MEIRLEGGGILDERSFHVAIAEALGVSKFYGNNLNALWDLLTTDVERPLVIIWNDWESSRNGMGGSFDAIVKTLRRVEDLDLEFGYHERFELRLISGKVVG